MADVTIDKKLKLANTRKRFKELQELKKKRDEGKETIMDLPNDEVSCTNSPEATPTESSGEPEHVSNVDALIEDNAHGCSGGNEHSSITCNPAILTEGSTSASATSYFENATYPSAAAFFDTIQPENTPQNISPSLLTYFNTSKQDSNANDSDNIGKAKYFDMSARNSLIRDSLMADQENNQQEYELFPHQGPFENSNVTDERSDVALDDPEIKQNEIRDYIRKSAENLAISSEPVSEYYQKNIENMFSTNDTEKLLNYLGSSASAQENVEISAINQEIDNSTNLTKKEIQHSNMESLRQLSDQLAQMIEPNYEYSETSSITDLEKRNIELAASLEREKINSEQLSVMNNELQKRILERENELKKTHSDVTLQGMQEISHLKSELQAHLQTIGLLVAEKTELSSNLSQYEFNHKQKIVECEELQGRLKTSRSRVSELEKELNSLKLEKDRSNNVEEHYNTTLQKLKQDYIALKEQKDDLAQDLLEVRERLKTTSEKSIELQQENKDLAGKLSLADIKIQQLSSGGAMVVDNQIEQLTQNKFLLENEVTQLNQTLKSIIKERDESSIQYQQYAQQLNAQINNLSGKLSQFQNEKENLLMQEQNRIKHIGELERQLQNLQNEHVSYSTSANNSELKNELEKIREMCVQLQIEKTSAEENYMKVRNEKELLLKELEAKTDSISQLESMIEHLRGNQPDSVKLLAAMESDKVAASRAIQQNKELKQQLESLQEVIMKMDNDKVELTENLKAQQLTNKELLEKLQKTEVSLQSLADAIEIKDKELTHLREMLEEASRKSLQLEQLEDRLRHYEAHDNSAHILQHELQNAKQTIARLTSDLNQVKIAHSPINQTPTTEIVEANTNKNISRTNEPQQILNHANQVSEENKHENDQPEINKTDKNENILDRENAMKYLEEKVTRTMQEIADLTDEKQRLEHIVLQLQSETETIGEYVAIYQHQRLILKQKALEKDQQLKQLAEDREQIKVKLDRLNQLIKKLVTEKGTVPTELIEHQENFKDHLNDLCEEHSKMNDDITRITDAQNAILERNPNENTSATAEEIISLLSEIKTSNLVQPDDSFKHCPWCSGQLITV